MANRFVSVGDDLTLPAAVKTSDANLPERLQTTALNATYAGKDVETSKLDVTAAAAAYEPKAPTRRAAFLSGCAGDNGTVTLGWATARYPVKLTQKTTRWRFKYSNYNTRGSSAGVDIPINGIWFGEHALSASGAGTGNFAATPAKIYNAGTIPGATPTQLVGEWITDPALQFSPGKQYLFSTAWGNDGVQRVAQKAVGTGWLTGNNWDGAVLAPALTQYSYTLGELQIEYEYVGNAPVTLHVGDSLTAGQANIVYNSWPEQYASRNNTAPIRLAASGSSSGTWTSNTSFLWTRIDWANIIPDAAFLALGSNDASAQTAQATYESQMATVAANIRAKGPKKLFLSTVAPRGWADADATETTRRGYNTWLRTLPLNTDGLMDADKVLRDPAAIRNLLADTASADNVHWNQYGHNEVAAIAPRLR